MRKKAFWFSGPAAGGAGMLALFYALGSFVKEDGISLAPLSPGAFVLRGLAAFGIGYPVLLTAFRAADRFEARSLPVSRRKVRRILGAVLGLCWLPVCIVCAPGNLTGDTLKSVLSQVNPENARNMPWALNLLYGGLIRGGDRLGSANAALCVFCSLQTLGFLWVFADGIALLWNRGVPKAALIAAAALYGVLPVFPTFAFSTDKDAIFALFLLGMSLCGLEALGKKDVPASLWIRMGVWGLGLSLTRNGAFWIVLTAWILFLWKAPGARRWLAGALALAAVGSFGAPRWIGGPGNQIRENLSLPLQQLARVWAVHGGELSEEERDQFCAVMTPEEWGDYNPVSADPVKLHFAAEPDGAYLSGFFSLWGRELAAHPGTCLEAAILQNYAYYTPDAELNAPRQRLYLGTLRYKEQNSREVAPTLTKNEKPEMETILAWDGWLNSVPGLRLLQRIGIYTWGLTAAAAYCLGRRGKRRFFAVLLPVALYAAGCLFSPVNGLYRYGLPLFTCLPLLGPGCCFLKPASAFPGPGTHSSASADPASSAG